MQRDKSVCSDSVNKNRVHERFSLQRPGKDGIEPLGGVFNEEAAGDDLLLFAGSIGGGGS